MEAQLPEAGTWRAREERLGRQTHLKLGWTTAAARTLARGQMLGRHRGPTGQHVSWRCPL